MSVQVIAGVEPGGTAKNMDLHGYYDRAYTIKHTKNHRIQLEGLNDQKINCTDGKKR